MAASADAWDEVLQAADSAYAYGDGAYITSFNGDDARGLAKIHDGDTTIIDLIGFYDIEADTSVDPGSGWDVAGVSAATANHTLIRKTDCNVGQYRLDRISWYGLPPHLNGGFMTKTISLI